MRIDISLHLITRVVCTRGPRVSHDLSFMHCHEIYEGTYMLWVLRAKIDKIQYLVYGRHGCTWGCELRFHTCAYGRISMHTYYIDTMLVHLPPLLPFLTCCLIVSLQLLLVLRRKWPTLTCQRLTPSLGTLVERLLRSRVTLGTLVLAMPHAKPMPHSRQ